MAMIILHRNARQWYGCNLKIYIIRVSGKIQILLPLKYIFVIPSLNSGCSTGVSKAEAPNMETNEENVESSELASALAPYENEDAKLVHFKKTKVQSVDNEFDILFDLATEILKYEKQMVDNIALIQKVSISNDMNGHELHIIKQQFQWTCIQYRRIQLPIHLLLVFRQVKTWAVFYSVIQESDHCYHNNHDPRLTVRRRNGSQKLPIAHAEKHQFTAWIAYSII